MEPQAALPLLAAARRPALIGLRHHSAALAAALPALLDQLDPDALFVELPAALQGWIPHLAHPAATAPLALALASVQGEQLGFYPFADFSPELVALRWARDHGVPVTAFDLDPHRRPTPGGPVAATGPGLMDHLDAQSEDDRWEAQVEALGAGGDPEALRRAALLFGYALRWDADQRGAIEGVDRAREAAMRAALQASPAQRPVAVVGAFHAAALLSPPLLPGDPPPPLVDGPAPVTALLPYPFALLDARSGYPAGVLDPQWRQSTFEHLRDGRPLRALAAELAVALCRDLRAGGHVASARDAMEVLRMAEDLSTLRGLPAPTRREFLDGVQSALGQGEALGRSLVLARHLEARLIGDRRGRLAPGTPQSGLFPHVVALLAALRLPGPDSVTAKEPTERRLDPLRSPLDRRRQVALWRMDLCHIPYAARKESVGETLTTVWSLAWTPATDALIEVAALGGNTLQTAAAGALLRDESAARLTDSWGPAEAFAQLEEAGEAGLPQLVCRQLEALTGELRDQAPARILTGLLDWIDRVEHGQVAGLPPAAEGEELGSVAAFTLPADLDRNALHAALFAALQGVGGAEDPAEAQALIDTTELCLRAPGLLADSRLYVLLRSLSTEGSPLMAAAADGARHRLRGDLDIADRLAGVLGAPDGATIAQTLTGGLMALGPAFLSDPALHGPLFDRVAAEEDPTFLQALPGLRRAFSQRPEPFRRALFAQAAARGGWGDRAVDPTLGPAADRLAKADRAGMAALERLGWPVDTAAIGAPAAWAPPPPPPRHGLSPADRWRLILGIDRAALSPTGRRLTRALDELYGAGAAPALFGGGGAGLEAAPPTVREWAGELGALFGATVREEVLAEAALQGRGAALLELDPEQVRPSVELLKEVLSLRGAVPEARLEPARRLIARIVAALVQALTVRVRPALTGLSTPRPTRRPNGRLDLGRTVLANLHTARPDGAGALHLSPERFVFRSRARRSLDWRLYLVVDTSGSMEPSLLYAAMMAAILHALPALSVHFFAFSTEVIDHSEQVDDPLSLLLGVEVGGGTRIAKAIAYTRSQITVPSRSLVVLITDFEEGDPPHRLPAELRALAESGVTLLGLAALDDAARPRYDAAMAARVVAAGMPVAALSPLELARWVAEQIRG